MSYSEWICGECGKAFDMPCDEAVGAVTCPACGSAQVKDAKLGFASKTASGSCTPKG